MSREMGNHKDMLALEEVKAAGELDRKIYDLREELKNVETGLLTINDIELITGRDNTNAPTTLLNKLRVIQERIGIFRVAVNIR